MRIVTFLRKNAALPKRVVDFSLESDTFQNKIMEIVKDFDEKSYNNNGKPWKSSRILRVKPNFFIFHCSSFFRHFSFHFCKFFSCLSFFNFSFLNFLCFSSFFFIFFPFLSCSLFFLKKKFLCFSFFPFRFLFVGCSKNLIFCLNFVTISLDISLIKIHFFRPVSGGCIVYQFEASFLFFLSLFPSLSFSFSFFFCFLCLFLIFSSICIRV